MLAVTRPELARFGGALGSALLLVLGLLFVDERLYRTVVAAVGMIALVVACVRGTWSSTGRAAAALGAGGIMVAGLAIAGDGGNLGGVEGEGKQEKG